jgi:hypothetical protein
MQSFFYLFTRYLAERARGQELSVLLDDLTADADHGLAIGTALNRLLMTKWSPMPPSQPRSTPPI